jgi:hypothetical protein
MKSYKLTLLVSFFNIKSLKLFHKDKDFVFRPWEATQSSPIGRKWFEHFFGHGNVFLFIQLCGENAFNENIRFK